METNYETKLPCNGFSLPLILLTVLISFVIAGGAYYFGSLKNKPQVQSSGPTLDNKILSPLPTPNVTSDWKIHTDAVWLFSVKYPPSWEDNSAMVDSPNDNPNAVSYYSCFSTFINSGAGLNQKNQYGVCLHEYKNPDKKSFKDFYFSIVSPQMTEVEKASFIYTQVQNLPYLVYKTSSEPKPTCSRSGIYCGDLNFFITDDNSRYISLSLHPFSNQQPYLDQEIIIKTVEQMLSTFKLIDQNEIMNTLNWKILKSDKFGFQFKHPSEWNSSLSDFSDLPKNQGGGTGQIAAAGVCVDIHVCPFDIRISAQDLQTEINKVKKNLQGNISYVLNLETPVEAFGLKGTKIVFNSKDDQYTPITYYFFNKDGKTFIFSLESGSSKGFSNNLQILKTADIIFNSFQFTN